MSPRLSSTVAVLLAFLGTSGMAVAVDGCGSDSSDGSGGQAPDASGAAPDGTAPGDASPEDGGADAVADGPNGKGETCIGFAKGSPCGANGFGDYGYVCINGSPPGIAGCKLATSSGSFGDTYCCTENKCVAQPDQDKECKAPATPHRYQCPPEGDGGAVAPAAGCTDAGAGGSALEHFSCCP